MATIFSPAMPTSARIVWVAVATVPLRMVMSSWSMRAALCQAIARGDADDETEKPRPLRLLRDHRAQGLQLAGRQAPRGALLPQRRALLVRRRARQRLRGAASAAQ